MVTGGAIHTRYFRSESHRPNHSQWGTGTAGTRRECELDYPSFWGVAGYPISHSLTPRLFGIVGSALGFGSVKAVSSRQEVRRISSKERQN